MASMMSLEFKTDSLAGFCRLRWAASTTAVKSVFNVLSYVEVE
jgi:hypothetical protein